MIHPNSAAFRLAGELVPADIETHAALGAIGAEADSVPKQRDTARAQASLLLIVLPALEAT